MGTREVYEQKLRSGNMYEYDPTINPGVGSPRCQRCLSLLNPINSELKPKKNLEFCVVPRRLTQESRNSCCLTPLVLVSPVVADLWVVGITHYAVVLCTSSSALVTPGNGGIGAFVAVVLLLLFHFTARMSSSFY